MARLQIQGAFNGFNGDAVFETTDGKVWQQAVYKYHYHYEYRPEVVIRKAGSSFVMEVPSMKDSVEVVPVSVLERGRIDSDFNGFDGDSTFEFDNGHVWQQDQYKYAYRYAYRPSAMVIQGRNGTVIHVDGMSDTVRVRRIK